MGRHLGIVVIAARRKRHMYRGWGDVDTETRPWDAVVLVWVFNSNTDALTPRVSHIGPLRLARLRFLVDIVGSVLLNRILARVTRHKI